MQRDRTSPAVALTISEASRLLELARGNVRSIGDMELLSTLSMYVTAAKAVRGDGS